MPSPLATAPIAQILVFWRGVQQGLNGFAHNPVEYAASVRCPVLLLHGEQDPRVSTLEVRSIYDNFGDDKELVLFPRAGHESYLADDSERWKRAVGEFLERVTSVAGFLRNPNVECRAIADYAKVDVRS